MASLATVVSAIIVGIITAEVIAHAPSLARWLIRRSVLKLPEVDRERHLEEWLAHAEELPGNLTKIFHGMDCYCRVARRIAQQRNEPNVELVAQRIVCSIARAYLWARVVPRIIPTMAVFALKGQKNNIRFFMVANRMLIETMIYQVVKRKAKSAEVTKALAFRSEQIRAILQNKPLPGSTPVQPNEPPYGPEIPKVSTDRLHN
jgi:hypothetical protein